MDKNWFECRISYDKMQDNGALKRITETYLVEAMNFSEAEKRITDSMQPFISGEFTVTVCNRRNYSAVLTGEGIYFRVKLIVTTIDEKTAKEKQENLFLIVQEQDLVHAVGAVDDYMRGSMEDWRYHTITETAIIDVFRRDE